MGASKTRWNATRVLELLSTLKVIAQSFAQVSMSQRQLYEVNCTLSRLGVRESAKLFCLSSWYNATWRPGVTVQLWIISHGCIKVGSTPSLFDVSTPCGSSTRYSLASKVTKLTSR